MLPHKWSHAAAAAKLLQSCPTLCDPLDGSPPGSPIPGILQARTLECVAISSSNAWKWKVKVKSLIRVQLFEPHGLQPTRLLCPWDSPGKNTGVGCHALSRGSSWPRDQTTLPLEWLKTEKIGHITHCWKQDTVGTQALLVWTYKGKIILENHLAGFLKGQTRPCHIIQ